MLKKIFVAIVFVVSVAGLSVSTGCSGGPSEVEMGTGSSDNFGAGEGETEDGEAAPDGAASID